MTSKLNKVLLLIRAMHNMTMRLMTGIISSLVSRFFHRAPAATHIQLAGLIERRFEEITYSRLQQRGWRPSGIIDIGAFHGDWSILANRFFGPVPTLMVEAQPDLLPFVEAARTKLSDSTIASCVLSEKAGEQVTFYKMATGSSMFPETSNIERKELHLITRTLDEIAADFAGGRDNLFLKIDVQGAELSVLRGGLATLARASLVQLEVAMLEYNKGAPLLPEVVAFMAEHGFFPIEVSGFSRPRDELVQIDMLFAPKDSELRPKSFMF